MKEIIFRSANIGDCKIYFDWVNDSEVRKNSFSSDIITWENHKRWFQEKIVKPQNRFYIFQNEVSQSIGQVRIERELDENIAVISLSIGSKFRGLGFASTMLKMGLNSYVKEFPPIDIDAYIKVENKSSQIIFEKAGFIFQSYLVFKNCQSSLYRYYGNRKL